MPGGMLRQHTTDAFQIALDIVDRWFAPFPLRRSRHPPASPQTTKTSARVGADLVMSVSTEHRPVAPPDGANCPLFLWAHVRAAAPGSTAPCVAAAETRRTVAKRTAQ